MTRYKITIEYEGTGLAGWQRQDDSYSVQEALATAIKNFCGEDVEITGSGRTDAGVHALGRVAHFDLAKEWDPFRVKEAINFHLRGDNKLPVPNQIAVLNAEQAADDFHARYGALKRYYVYRIINRRAHLTLERERAWGVVDELDAAAMHEAAQILVGQHDFSSFRATECQAKSSVKTLDEISVTRTGELVEVKCAARSFLHHQVRNFVGSLKLVGSGKWTKEDLRKALLARDRTKAGPTAPACGLYFVKVDY